MPRRCVRWRRGARPPLIGSRCSPCIEHRACGAGTFVGDAAFWGHARPRTPAPGALAGGGGVPGSATRASLLMVNPSAPPMGAAGAKPPGCAGGQGSTAHIVARRRCIRVCHTAHNSRADSCRRCGVTIRDRNQVARRAHHCPTPAVEGNPGAFAALVAVWQRLHTWHAAAAYDGPQLGCASWRPTPGPSISNAGATDLPAVLSCRRFT